MGQVKTTFVSDDKDLAASIDKLNRKVDELNATNKRLSEESAATKQKSKEGFGAMVEGAGRALLSYQALAAGIQLINKELRAQIELQNKAAGVQLNAASGEREYLRQLGTVSPAQRQAALAGIQGISGRQGVPVSQLYGPMGRALSAAGGPQGGGLQRSLFAVEQAARIAPDSPQGMESFAAAIVAISQGIKADTEQDKVKRALNVLVRSQTTSSVSDIGQLATYMPRGLTRARTHGWNPEIEGEALFDTFTNLLTDTEGAIASEGMGDFAARLRAFLPEQDVKSKSGKTLRRGVGAMTGLERFQMIERDPKLRKQFLESMEQSKTKDVAELITNPGSPENRAFKALIEEKRRTSPDMAERFTEGLGATPLQATAELDRRFNSSIENELLGKTAAARYSIIRNRVDEALEASGNSYLDRTAFGWEAYARSFSQSPEEMGINTLESVIQGRQRGFMQDGTYTKKEARDIAERQLPALVEMLQVLKSMDRKMRSSNMDAHTE